MKQKRLDKVDDEYIELKMEFENLAQQFNQELSIYDELCKKRADLRKINEELRKKCVELEKKDKKYEELYKKDKELYIQDHINIRNQLIHAFKKRASNLNKEYNMMEKIEQLQDEIIEKYGPKIDYFKNVHIPPSSQPEDIHANRLEHNRGLLH